MYMHLYDGYLQAPIYLCFDVFKRAYLDTISISPFVYTKSRALSMRAAGFLFSFPWSPVFVSLTQRLSGSVDLSSARTPTPNPLDPFPLPRPLPVAAVVGDMAAGQPFWASWEGRGGSRHRYTLYEYYTGCRLLRHLLYIHIYICRDASLQDILITIAAPMSGKHRLTPKHPLAYVTRLAGGWDLLPSITLDLASPGAVGGFLRKLHQKKEDTVHALSLQKTTSLDAVVTFLLDFVLGHNSFVLSTASPSGR
jgi:hypothetical protein